MPIGQPFDYIRRGAIRPDDTDDKAGTNMAARHPQHVTSVRPHHSSLSGASGVVIKASANDPVLLSLTGLTVEFMS
jgi:hypothetical protein